MRYLQSVVLSHRALTLSKSCEEEQGTQAFVSPAAPSPSIRVCLLVLTCPTATPSPPSPPAWGWGLVTSTPSPSPVSDRRWKNGNWELSRAPPKIASGACRSARCPSVQERVTLLEASPGNASPPPPAPRRGPWRAGNLELLG